MSSDNPAKGASHVPAWVLMPQEDLAMVEEQGLVLDEGAYLPLPSRSLAATATATGGGDRSVKQKSDAHRSSVVVKSTPAQLENACGRTGSRGTGTSIRLISVDNPAEFKDFKSFRAASAVLRVHRSLLSMASRNSTAVMGWRIVQHIVEVAEKEERDQDHPAKGKGSVKGKGKGSAASGSVTITVLAAAAKTGARSLPCKGKGKRTTPSLDTVFPLAAHGGNAKAPDKSTRPGTAKARRTTSASKSASHSNTTRNVDGI